eukprot:7308023-Alexandrium_andersonii.AAC.1
MWLRETNRPPKTAAPTEHAWPRINLMRGRPWRCLTEASCRVLAPRHSKCESDGASPLPQGALAHLSLQRPNRPVGRRQWLGTCVGACPGGVA